MMSLLLYPVVGLVGTVAATIILWFTKPAIIIRYGMKIVLGASGLRVKFVTVNNKRYCYAERGVPSEIHPTMVFVHGFSASKDMWAQIVKKLPKHLHIVVLDLPGHGDSYVPGPHEDISFEAYVEAMKEVISALGIDSRPFHLIGTSFGGIVSGLYAATHGSDLVKVSLVCPAVRTPIETHFMHEVRAGHCRLIPEDAESLQTMIDTCVYKKTKINKQILHGYIELRKPRNPFYRRLFEEIMTTESNPIRSKALEDKSNEIKVPLQVIWGKHDELIHPSGAEKMRAEISSCVRVDMIEKCGHSVNMDRPGQLVKLLLEFRGELEPSSSTVQNGKH